MELRKSFSTATRTKAGRKKGDRLCPGLHKEKALLAYRREGRRGSHLCRWRLASIDTSLPH